PNGATLNRLDNDLGFRIERALCGTLLHARPLSQSIVPVATDKFVLSLVRHKIPESVCNHSVLMIYSHPLPSSRVVFSSWRAPNIEAGREGLPWSPIRRCKESAHGPQGAVALGRFVLGQFVRRQ